MFFGLGRDGTRVGERADQATEEVGRVVFLPALPGAKKSKRVASLWEPPPCQLQPRQLLLLRAFLR